MPGIHKGPTDAILKPTIAPGQVPAADEVTKAEEQSCKVVKAPLLISGADQCRYRGLKDGLANNYLLGTDPYPNTYDKAMRVLGNYQVTRSSVAYRASPVGD